MPKSGEMGMLSDLLRLFDYVINAQIIAERPALVVLCSGSFRLESYNSMKYW